MAFPAVMNTYEGRKNNSVQNREEKELSTADNRTAGLKVSHCSTFFFLCILGDNGGSWNSCWKANSFSTLKEISVF